MLQDCTKVRVIILVYILPNVYNPQLLMDFNIPHQNNMRSRINRSKAGSSNDALAENKQDENFLDKTLFERFRSIYDNFDERDHRPGKEGFVSFLTSLYGSFNQELEKYDLLRQLEEFSGVRRSAIVLFNSIIVIVSIVCGIGANFWCNVVGAMYPSYATIHSLALDSDNSHSAMIKWKVYWIIYGLLSSLELLFEDTLLWLGFLFDGLSHILHVNFLGYFHFIILLSLAC